MTTKPYPTCAKIFEASKRAGHVVSFEAGTTTIETGDLTMTYGETGKIKDQDGKEYSNAEAAETLGLEIK
jgi:hypothetical protein